MNEKSKIELFHDNCKVAVVKPIKIKKSLIIYDLKICNPPKKCKNLSFLLFEIGFNTSAKSLTDLIRETRANAIVYNNKNEYVELCCDCIINHYPISNYILIDLVHPRGTKPDEIWLDISIRFNKFKINSNKK